jgi:ankyrin repeat protein
MEILQALINHRDININHVDVYHRTALHYACEKNYFFSIVYLLQAGLNIDTEVKDYEGNTPLAICLRHRNLNQAALLLKRGVK